MVVNFKIDVLYYSLRNKIKYTQKCKYNIHQNHTKEIYLDALWAKYRYTQELQTVVDMSDTRQTNLAVFRIQTKNQICGSS